MSLDGIIQVKERSEISIVIKNSVFYGYAIPLFTYEEIPQLLEECKAKQREARHHAYAWRFLAEDKQQYQRFSDDGEPAKTAGPPIFNVLERGAIQNTLIVVSRIFGGILLGKGGLVHAYGGAAEQAVQAAKLVRLERRLLRALEFDYTYLNALTYWLNQANVTIDNVVYTERVRLEFGIEASQLEALRTFYAELTSTPAIFSELGTTYRRVDL